MAMCYYFKCVDRFVRISAKPTISCIKFTHTRTHYCCPYYTLVLCELRTTKCGCMRDEAYECALIITHMHISISISISFVLAPKAASTSHSHKRTHRHPNNESQSVKGASLSFFTVNLNTLLDCTRCHKRVLIRARNVKCSAFFSSFSLLLLLAHHTHAHTQAWSREEL